MRLPAQQPQTDDRPTVTSGAQHRGSPPPGARGARCSVRGVREGGDRGAAMMLVLVVMLIGAALAVLALGAVTQQVGPTLVERKHVRALHASEAGLQVALGRIQTAVMPDTQVVGAVVGNRLQLPCLTGGERITGPVGGEPGGLTYSVRIRYYAEDPGPRPASWRDTPANVLACPLPSQPSYALLQSTGDSAVGAVGTSVDDRTTELVYRFRTDTTNAAGGPISSGTACWDVGAVPVVGSPVLTTPCVAGAPGQRFWWRDDNTIVLSSSVGTAPLCVVGDRPPGSTATTVPARLAACDGLLHQSWGVEGNARLYGFPSNTSGQWYLCTSGGAVVAQSAYCGSAFTSAQAVGSGRAGSVSATTSERVIHWVSYQEFGRCLDVNSWDVNRDLILYPCKQDPLTSELRWNQGWYYGKPDSQQTSEVYTYSGVPEQDYSAARQSNATRVCLDGSAATGVPLRLRTCAGTPDQRLLVNRQVTRADGQVDYSRSYTIVDRQGRCLDLGPVTTSTGEWSSVRWSTCSGASSQKWNAPPTFTASTQTAFREGS